MDQLETLVFRKDELPKRVTLVGDNGEQEHYAIVPAGKKLGACMQKVTRFFHK